MRADERDRDLARALDRAVARIRVSPDGRLDAIRRRGSHRRALGWIAAATAVAVFAGSVTVAALTFGGHHRPPRPVRPAGWSSAGGSDAGWRLSYPTAWHLRLIDDRRCAASSVRVGAFVSNVRFPLRHPDGTSTGLCNGGRWVFAGFARNGVALEIEPVGAMGPVTPQPDTPFPIRSGDLQPTGGIRGGPTHTYLGVWRAGDLPTYVRLYVGHDASRQSIQRIERTLESLRLDVPAPTPSPSRCLTPQEAADSPVAQSGETLHGDVTGDGAPDRVTMIHPEGAPSRCRVFLVVKGPRARPVGRRIPGPYEPDLRIPRLSRLARIDRVPGSEIVLAIDEGAHSNRFAVFTMRSDRIVRMVVRDGPPDVGREGFFSTSSAGAGVGNVGCVGRPGSGEVVQSSTGMTQRPTTMLTREFFRVEGTEFVYEPARTEHIRVRSRGSFEDRFPEFSYGTDELEPFDNCGPSGVETTR